MGKKRAREGGRNEAVRSVRVGEGRRGAAAMGVTNAITMSRLNTHPFLLCRIEHTVPRPTHDRTQPQLLQHTAVEHQVRH